MPHRVRTRALVLAVAVVTLLLSPASAHARHNFSMLEVTPQQAAPGQEVRVSGFSYTETAVVRFGSLDGPVLARVEPSDNNDIAAVVRIPADAEPGRSVLYAMHEDAGGNPTRFPGRAAITVVGPGGVPLGAATGLEVEPRPSGLLVQASPSARDLVLTALAAAGAAGLVLGLATAAMARRRGAVKQARS